MSSSPGTHSFLHRRHECNLAIYTEVLSFGRFRSKRNSQRFSAITSFLGWCEHNVHRAPSHLRRHAVRNWVSACGDNVLHHFSHFISFRVMQCNPISFSDFYFHFDSSRSRLWHILSAVKWDFARNHTLFPLYTNTPDLLFMCRHCALVLTVDIGGGMWWLQYILFWHGFRQNTCIYIIFQVRAIACISFIAPSSVRVNFQLAVWCVQMLSKNMEEKST